MSFIVKGMDLPKKGERYHIFIENSRIRCDKWTNTDRSYLDERYEGNIDIQVIQIPKDHGNIIDRDELIEHLQKDPLFSLVENYGITGVIESRPVILEEEKEYGT